MINNRVFPQHTELAILVLEGFLQKNKNKNKMSDKILPPVSTELNTSTIPV